MSSGLAGYAARNENFGLVVESRVTGEARTARLAAAECGVRGHREAVGGGPGRSPV